MAYTIRPLNTGYIPTRPLEYWGNTGITDPEVDRIFLDRIKGIQDPKVLIHEIPGNLDTEEWGIQAAQEMLVAHENKNVI